MPGKMLHPLRLEGKSSLELPGTSFGRLGAAVRTFPERETRGMEPTSTGFSRLRLERGSQDPGRQVLRATRHEASAETFAGSYDRQHGAASARDVPADAAHGTVRALHVMSRRQDATACPSPAATTNSRKRCLRKSQSRDHNRTYQRPADYNRRRGRRSYSLDQDPNLHELVGVGE